MESNFTSAQLEELRDYFRQAFPGFEITSSNKTSGHGSGDFCLTTDNQQGVHFYEQGNMKVSSNRSIELYSGRKSENKDTTIAFRSYHGNIILEAEDGDIVLKGKNVKIESTDAKGIVSIISPKNILSKAPNIKTDGDNVNITASNELKCMASYVTSHGEISNEVSDGVSISINSALLSKILTIIEDVKKFFKSPCG